MEFENLSQLQTVDLSSNQLHAIPPSILLNCSTILRLNLSGNFLDSASWPRAESWPRGESASWPRAESWNLPILQIFDLSWNRLQFLPPGAFGANFTGIMDLDLSGNSLETLGEFSFGSMPNLRRLDLSNNFLTELKPEIFDTGNSGNSGSETGSSGNSGNAERSGNSGNLKNLVEFRAKNNSISKIFDGFFLGISSLKILDLSQNFLLELPGALTPLYYLEELDLESNRISTIAKFLLDKIKNLKILNLSKNRLTIVER